MSEFADPFLRLEYANSRIIGSCDCVIHGGVVLQVEEGTIEGDYELSSELKMLGMFTGNVTVKDGGHLVLYGIASQDIIVEAGATVEVHGMVKGKVNNNGGTLTVSPGAYVGG